MTTGEADERTVVSDTRTVAADDEPAVGPYDGRIFRRLREQYHVELTTVIHAAAVKVGSDVFQVSREHVRQWERNKRSISTRMASTLAYAMTAITGHDVQVDHFEAGVARRVAA